MQRVPMTPAGHAALTVELKHLKEVVRFQIVRDIEEARAHGDISENSEFEDAKHRQALTEGRIRELESKLSASEIIDIKRIPASDRVIFGVTVDLEDLTSEDEVTYQIVGTDEANVRDGKISVTSPIGRALVGREVGDEITVRAPGGLRKYVIVDAHYK